MGNFTKYKFIYSWSHNCFLFYILNFANNVHASELWTGSGKAWNFGHGYGWIRIVPLGLLDLSLVFAHTYCVIWLLIHKATCFTPKSFSSVHNHPLMHSFQNIDCLEIKANTTTNKLMRSLHLGWPFTHFLWLIIFIEWKWE